MKAKKYGAREKTANANQTHSNIDYDTDDGNEKNAIDSKSNAIGAQTQSNKETSSDNEDLLIKEYEGMLGSSGDEGEGGGYLNPNINYNEVQMKNLAKRHPMRMTVTNASASSEENEPRRKKPKLHNLPELMAGYYSGNDTEEESDEDNKMLMERRKRETQQRPYGQKSDVNDQR